MTFSDLKLTIPEVAEATGVTAPQIRRWIETRKTAKPGQGVPILGKDGDKISEGRGDDTLISWHTTLQIAIAGRLTARGVSVSDALNAGIDFAHMGDSEATWGDEPPKLDRAPGETYQNGETWLLVAGDYSRVVNITDEGNGYHQYTSLDSAVRSFQSQGKLVNSALLGYSQEAVVVLNMDFFSDLISRRTESVLEEKREKNTRLRHLEQRIHAAKQKLSQLKYEIEELKNTEFVTP